MGDTDGILSLAGAWGWIRKRKYKVTRPWTPYLDRINGQLVGFVKEYNNFSIVTVHGFGHGGSISRYDEIPELLFRFMNN